jgi:hypothetical protein
MRFCYERFSRPRGDRGKCAYTLVEVIMGLGICVIALVSFFGALSGGFGIVEGSREDLRATQILEEKMEVIRLYTWEQINDATFIPVVFSVPYYPRGDAGSQGFRYYGTLAITNSGIGEVYSDDLRSVIVTLNWTNGTHGHSRTASTFVSKHGLHQYVYTQK